MSKELFINSAQYDSRFVDLIESLESCATSNTDSDQCPLEDNCRDLSDTLADKVTHYKITETQYRRFMEHFKKLKKQLVTIWPLK